jgi:hypothetical protein
MTRPYLYYNLFAKRSTPSHHSRDALCAPAR